VKLTASLDRPARRNFQQHLCDVPAQASGRSPNPWRGRLRAAIVAGVASKQL